MNEVMKLFLNHNLKKKTCIIFQPCHWPWRGTAPAEVWCDWLSSTRRAWRGSASWATSCPSSPPSDDHSTLRLRIHTCAHTDTSPFCNVNSTLEEWNLTLFSVDLTVLSVGIDIGKCVVYTTLHYLHV